MEIYPKSQTFFQNSDAPHGPSLNYVKAVHIPVFEKIKESVVNSFNYKYKNHKSTNNESVRISESANS